MADPLSSPRVPPVATSRLRSEVDARGRALLETYAAPELAALGVLDATRSPYLADPTGTRDSTEAISRAIADARDARLVTYLPAGRYLISDTLVGLQGVVRRDHWPYGASSDPMVENESWFYPCTLTGARSGGKTVLMLAKHAPAFDDPEQPRPMVHFWARAESEFDPSQPPAETPQPNISFNQQILDITFDLGGHPGAIAIHHQAAQFSVIEEVSIDATGAFAGLRALPGSGGSVHGLRVTGGRYGIYARGTARHRGSQPVPVVSSFQLLGQTDAAVLYDGRGPLTLVGGEIDGAGIVVEAPPECRFNGPLSVVDCQVTLRRPEPAIRSRHAVALDNVWFRGTKTAVELDGTPALSATPESWTRIIAWNGGTDLLGGDRANPTAERGMPPPADLVSRHTWQRPFPDRDAAQNVRAHPYLAVGDGRADDTDALQRAIDEHETVFLPKGTYALSRPLRLHARTRLIGIGQVYSTLLAREDAPVFRDALRPAPLVETVDDPEATTTLAFIELRVPVRLAGAYALRWRAGRGSVVRNVALERTAWHPDAPGLFHPFCRIEGHGGGRWYRLQQAHWWSQCAHYRHLLISGTREPLKFYMLNPEHARCDAQVEIARAENVDIYSLKAEGNHPVAWIHDCRGIRIFGYGGNGTPWPGWSLFRVERCRAITLANLAPQHAAYVPGRWTGLGITLGPEGWFLVGTETESIPAQAGVVSFQIRP